MKTELGKWNPFKFLRRSADEKGGVDEPTDEGSRPRVPDWPMSRFFSGNPWRTMGELLHEPLPHFSGLERWFGDFSSSRFHPRIDVVDDGNAIRVTVELPGMDRDQVQTTIEDGTLVVRGEKRQDAEIEENGCYRLERAYGAFLRSIPLPEGLDFDQVDARFVQGVLTLRFPKNGGAPPSVRKIDIQ